MPEKKNIYVSKCLCLSRCPPSFIWFYGYIIPWKKAWNI